MTHNYAAPHKKYYNLNLTQLNNNVQNFNFTLYV